MGTPAASGCNDAMTSYPPGRHDDDLLERIAAATAPATGAAFFRALVENCAKALAFREVFVTECIGGHPGRVRMLCHWLDDDFAEDVEYELAGTPCARTILEGRTTFIGDRLEALYPSWPGQLAYLGVPVFDSDGATVAGHLAFYDDRPRADIAALPVFRILAARAGAELLRLRAEARARRHLAAAATASRRAALHDMASAIAHEINQPLTSVHAYAQACARLLRAGETTPPEAVEYLERIETQAERAALIVQRLRRFVGDGAASSEDVAVASLVADAMSLTAPHAEAAGVALAAEMPASLPPLRGDPVQLQQVLINLLRNAIEAAVVAAPADRRVRLTARAEGGTITLMVADTGPGISPHVAARLFEPYFSTKPDGMGIGLSVSRAIVEAHGGWLRAAPLAGGGACFSVELPVAAVTPAGPGAN
jgi:signal transduction histidine kinase